jgi:hypothetical protein
MTTTSTTESRKVRRPTQADAGKADAGKAPAKKGAKARAAKPHARGERKVVAAPAVERGSRGQRKGSKQQICIELLKRPEGATIEQLQKATGWQAHSVRGFLAGTVKKKLGLSLASEKPEDGTRRYRIVQKGS